MSYKLIITNKQDEKPSTYVWRHCKEPTEPEEVINQFLTKAWDHIYNHRLDLFPMLIEVHNETIPLGVYNVEVEAIPKFYSKRI